MIRVGEKILSQHGPKRPLLLGSGFTVIGLILLSLTFLPEVWYIISSIVGYLLFGTGLGLYATPSTDTAVASAPDDKSGVASGVYKMASSLGNAFGVAVSGTVYTVLAANLNLNLGGFTGMMFNALLAIVAFLVIISSLLTICVIFLVRMLYIKYTQNIMSHKIWLLVLVSTLIPLIPFYKISNFTFSKDMMNRNVSDTTSSVSHMLDGQQSSVTKDLAINVNQFETSNITYMILLIWVFGSLLCLFYMIKAFRQIDVIKSSSLESSYLNERLKVCQSKMQFYKKHITISYSSNIDNPMVFGLVKSQIVLPTVVVETMNDKEIEYIILHELSHVKSHDLIFNQLYVVFKMIFWFNPALYISKTMMDNDCEKYVIETF